MMKLWRSIILVSMLALFSGNILLFAQESTEEAEATVVQESTEEAQATPEGTEEVQATPVVEPVIIAVSGSGIVNSLLESVLAASNSGIALEATTNGTSAGFADLCTGTSSITTASRAINTDETLACSESTVEFYELIVGFDIPALIANPQDTALTCLTVDQINSVFAPSAINQITNWGQIGLAETLDLALTPIVPADTTTTYAAFENFVEGIGLRADATIADSAGAIATVESTSGAIAVVPLQAALDAQASVQILSVDFGDGSGCLQPSAEAVEDSLYNLATPLLVYVNAAAAEQLAPALALLTSDESANLIAAAGYTPVSAAQTELNRAILRGERENQSVATAASFEIPADLTGSFTVGGSLAGYRIADSIANRLSSSYQGVTSTRQFNGQLGDAAKLCDGSLDILFTTNQLPEEQQQACADAGISTANVALGAQAVVLVANNGDDFASCLTTDQIRTIWSNTSAGTVLSWNNVAETFPETALTLFALREGNYLNDLLMVKAGAIADTVRTDVAEQNTDALYRAAATANVAGALTYMGWADYERVLANNQQNIQIVAVNAGDGCVVPNLETIENGTYPLSQQVGIVINQSALATKAVQSYVWSIFADENQSLFTASGMIAPAAITDLRTNLLLQFAEAEQKALEQAAEVTPEATEQTP
jgi:phosphate transport system substrate-binding protein